MSYTIDFKDLILSLKMQKNLQIAIKKNKKY